MGFVNKHKKRDSELPNYRRQLLDAIERDLINDENVKALFYGGSIGNEITDNYSDIDLRVVVKPDKINEYISNKENRAKNWGNVLYFEDLNRFSIYTVAHYDCFVKVDTFYYTPDNIQPSIWLKNIKIAKDTDNMMLNILEGSMDLTYKPSMDEFETWKTKFFAYLHEAYRRTMRKEYYYALNCVDKLRLSMTTAWYMNSGIQPNTFGDWAKYEGDRSKLENWQKSLLINWECGRDTKEIFNVLTGIVHEFKKAHSSLCDTLEIKENSEQLNKIVNMVL